MQGRSFVSWYPWGNGDEEERPTRGSSCGGTNHRLGGKEEHPETKTDRETYRPRQAQRERADGRRGGR